MKQGDFTLLAKNYVNRAGYSEGVLRLLMKHVGADKTKVQVADVGAGTGKLTENLLELGLSVTAVEPNDSMREEGIRYTSRWDPTWIKGSGEMTNLNDAFADWLLMGSSFHWVNRDLGLKEFHRVIKPGGFFTALWNPREIERSDLHQKIEASIYDLLPSLNRVSSGSAKYTQNLFSDLVSTGHFKDPIFIEAPHEERMSPERYLGAWRSVNDIQAQAGPELFEKIICVIAEQIRGIEYIDVPYKTRSWTVQRVD